MPMPSALRMASVVALALALIPRPGLAGEVQLDSPRGGWSVAGVLGDDEAPAQAYPYNLIDRGAQKHRTLIKGRLTALQRAHSQAAGGQPPAPSGSAGTSAPPRRQAYQLVVNGNPMPLYTGEDGRFVRPYAFGQGSNSIEIKGPPGSPGKRVQFHARHGQATAALRAILSWDDKQAEVDLHVITPDGQHAFWASPVLQGGGGLDVDSVDGAGPEMFSITAPQAGAYHFYVNYWGNFGNSGYHFDERTRTKPVITVRMTLVMHENTPREKRETFVVPLRNIGDLMVVRSVAMR